MSSLCQQNPEQKIPMRLRAACSYVTKYLPKVAIVIKVNIYCKHFNFTWWILILGVSGWVLSVFFFSIGGCCWFFTLSTYCCVFYFLHSTSSNIVCVIRSTQVNHKKIIIIIVRLGTKLGKYKQINKFQLKILIQIERNRDWDWPHSLRLQTLVAKMTHLFYSINFTGM